MKKVKVQRYISGKKPDYAQGASSSEDSDNDDFIEQQRPERRQQALPQIIGKEDELPSDDDANVSIENNTLKHWQLTDIVFKTRSF